MLTFLSKNCVYFLMSTTKLQITIQLTMKLAVFFFAITYKYIKVAKF